MNGHCRGLQDEVISTLRSQVIGRETIHAQTQRARSNRQPRVENCLFWSKNVGPKNTFHTMFSSRPDITRLPESLLSPLTDRLSSRQVITLRSSADDDFFVEETIVFLWKMRWSIFWNYPNHGLHGNKMESHVALVTRMSTVQSFELQIDTIHRFECGVNFGDANEKCQPTLVQSHFDEEP